MIRAAFLGTPESAVPSLVALDELCTVPLAVTRPDAPSRRGKKVVPSPVKLAAMERDIAVVTPSSRAELADALSEIELDVAVVVAYGMLIPRDVLERPPRGMINVHFSLLPRWRGAAPVERAMLAGDTQTGVSLMAMDEGLDTGGVLATWRTSIEADESGGELTDRLARAGAELLANELPRIVEGELIAATQDHASATYASKLSTGEAAIDWTSSGHEITRMIRAFSPRPGAHTLLAGERFKIHNARAIRGDGAPGAIEIGEHGVSVGTGSGAVALDVVQPAGGRAMPASDWARGLQEAPGAFS